MMLRIFSQNLDRCAKNRESESANSSETLTSSDLVASPRPNSESVLTWLRLFSQEPNSELLPTNSNLQRRVLTFSGKTSVTVSMRFSQRRVLRNPSTSKLIMPEPCLSMVREIQPLMIWDSFMLFKIDLSHSSLEKDSMPRASSKIKIDTTISNAVQNVSSRL
jgi:hypothetical protein